ncbi:hypothetical protein ACFX1Q_046992 [Malus domestica]
MVMLRLPRTHDSWRIQATLAAQLGLKTTCIEKRGALDGTCLNVRCIPSKALLHSSHMYYEAKHAFSHHGVKFSNVEIDLPAMMSQKDKVVSNLTRGIEGLFKKNKVTYVKRSDVKSLPGITIDEKKLVVVGARYIGLEMGSVWGRLGFEVTVVEFGPDIVPSMDSEICKQFQCPLEKLVLQAPFFRETVRRISLEASVAKGADQGSAYFTVKHINPTAPSTLGLSSTDSSESESRNHLGWSLLGFPKL